MVIDKSGANLPSRKNMHSLFMLNERLRLIDILQVIYLNNIIEQNNRFIKKITCPMKGSRRSIQSPLSSKRSKSQKWSEKTNSPPKDNVSFWHKQTLSIWTGNVRSCTERGSDFCKILNLIFMSAYGEQSRNYFVLCKTQAVGPVLKWPVTWSTVQIIFFTEFK